MGIDIKTVEKVATLARLELNKSELENLTGDLADIIGYVDKLGELDVSKTEPMSHAALGALLREDVRGKSIDRSKILEGAPDASAEFFRVPKIIDDGGSA